MATKSLAASPEKVNRAVAFVNGLVERYTLYRDHKESMAFTGLTLFTGAAGAALVTDAWPPNWGDHTKLLAILAVTALWLGVLANLRFQLRRRRWAALRVAGCERILAEWIMSPPSELQLTPRKRDAFIISRWVACADFFWPQKAAVTVVEPAREDDPSIYPSALVDYWISQETRGTAALIHERLMTSAGWILYVVVVLHTAWKAVA